MNPHVDELTADTKGFQAAIVQAGERWAHLQADDEMSPSITVAFAVAYRLSLLLDRWPNRIVLNGDDGLVIERWEGQVFETWEVSDRGEVEYCRFVDCKLVERKPYTLPARKEGHHHNNNPNPSQA